MTRQRIKLRTPLLAYLVRGLSVLLGLGLIWYGLMVALLAVKVSPHTVNSLSAFRTLINDAESLSIHDFTTPVRLIAGFAGLLLFLALIFLALQELPRPYLARSEVELQNGKQGVTLVKPRAIERVAEIAAQQGAAVTSAAGRLGEDDLNVMIEINRASRAAEALQDVRERVRAELDRHDLPKLPVNVTLTGYERKTRRELS